MKILIGNTGLIGQTLKKSICFDFEFNSKNINLFENNKYIDKDSDLYLSCLPATKWMVNQNIEKDLLNINLITDILKKRKYKNIFLISTIDVYSSSPKYSDEDYFPNFSGLDYGSNRLIFESIVDKLVEKENLYIIRLPALFGKYIKKNVLYDLLNDNNIEKINLNSYYQWYDLNDLVGDINYIVNNFPNEKIFNFFTEPIYTEDILLNFFPNYNLDFKSNLVEYNYKTKYYDNGYMRSKKEIFEKMEKFIYEIRNQ